MKIRQFLKVNWPPLAALAVGMAGAFTDVGRSARSVAAAPRPQLSEQRDVEGDLGDDLLPPDHPPIPADGDGEEADQVAGGFSDAMLGPHPGAGKSADEVPVRNVPKAKGPHGRTVEEINVGRVALSGHTVRVRGIVVKSTPGVLGRTFLHLRDGTGDAESGSRDLTVTTQTEPAVGSDVLFEGTVQSDQDFGSGYRYDVVLRDATLVSE